MNQYKVATKLQLDGFVCTHWNEINAYIDEQMRQHPVPIYSSVDIRESLDKYAPVDHNMYPAGFNNVCALDLEACSKEFRKQILAQHEKAKVVGIIPESHTKNLFYLDHLAILSKTIRDAGFEVKIVSPDQALFTENETLHLVSHSQYDVTISKLQINDGILLTEGQQLDVVVLNNDQSSPLDVAWREVKTPVVPTPLIGWFARQKIKHFTYYNKVVQAFANKFAVDPFLLEAKFRFKDDVDFGTKEGIDELASEVDKLIEQIGKKDSPVFVKASQGTYGMGIMVVKSGEEVKEMNRRDRNKMDVGKNKIKFTSVIIQEGVETVLKYDNMPAEVTIYLVGGKSLGGFMRANQERGANENLNAKGMVFRRYCISEIKQNQDYQCKEAVYSIIARLSTWAAALEIEEALK